MGKICVFFALAASPLQAQALTSPFAWELPAAEPDAKNTSPNHSNTGQEALQQHCNLLESAHSIHDKHGLLIFNAAWSG